MGKPCIRIGPLLIYVVAGLQVALRIRQQGPACQPTVSRATTAPCQVLLYEIHNEKWSELELNNEAGRAGGDNGLGVMQGVEGRVGNCEQRVVPRLFALIWGRMGTSWVMYKIWPFWEVFIFVDAGPSAVDDVRHPGDNEQCRPMTLEKEGCLGIPWIDDGRNEKIFQMEWHFKKANGGPS